MLQPPMRAHYQDPDDSQCTLAPLLGEAAMAAQCRGMCEMTVALGLGYYPNGMGSR